jgi:hypothetical protein
LFEDATHLVADSLERVEPIALHHRWDDLDGDARQVLRKRLAYGPPARVLDPGSNRTALPLANSSHRDA